MKNYRDSDYAVNKYAKGIVYRFANQTVEVTLEDFMRENPNKNEADFAKLKAISDEIYFRQDRQENAQSKKTVSINNLEETVFFMASPDENFIAAVEQAESQTQKLQLAQAILDKLTEVQRRRYILHRVKSLSTWKIAKMEDVAQRSVMDSLEAAEKKIKKVLASR